MAYEQLECNIVVHDNVIEITPINGMNDNSIYEINIRGLKSKDTFEDVNLDLIKFVTTLTPSYCTLFDVESILNILEIDSEVIMYNIREASKYAQYVYEKYNNVKIDINNIPFVVKEYTRYKAARDCLVKIYMCIVSSRMVEGTLGEVKFKVRDSSKDLKSLLDWLDHMLDELLDALQGYELEGRAKMSTAVKGLKFKPKNIYKNGGLYNIPLSISRRGKYD